MTKKTLVKWLESYGEYLRLSLFLTVAVWTVSITFGSEKLDEDVVIKYVIALFILNPAFLALMSELLDFFDDNSPRFKF